MLFLYNALLKHDIINGFKSIKIHPWLLSAQAKDTVSLLAVEIFGLCVDAPESVIKHVDSVVEILTKVERVLGNETLVSATLSISLVESASVLISASTVHLVTVKELEVFTH